MNIIIDDDQAKVLLRLIRGVHLSSVERRELIQLEDILFEHVNKPDKPRSEDDASHY